MGKVRPARMAFAPAARTTPPCLSEMRNIDTVFRNLFGEVERMSIEHVLHERRTDIERIAARHGVVRMRIFGSVARGEATTQSDIDFLVETGPVTSA